MIDKYTGTKSSSIIGCIVTIVLVVIMVIGLGHLTRPVGMDKSLNTIETFHNLPEDSVEVIAYGSSHTWLGVNPIEMYKSYGIGSYNYGAVWQRFNTTEVFLDDSLKTQSPKVVLIETFKVAELLENVDMNGEIWYAKSLPDSEVKQKYLKQVFGDDKERWLSLWVPLAAFHQNWTDLSSRSFMWNSDETDFYKTMGFREADKATVVDIPDQSLVKQRGLKDSSIEILDHMVAMCKENDIEVVFFTVPYAGEYQYCDAMTEYAKQNGCVYINLFDYVEEMGIDGATDFKDEGHLNTSGATKVANYLGAYLVENYDLTDMRNVENNIWEQALQR